MQNQKNDHPLIFKGFEKIKNDNKLFENLELLESYLKNNYKEEVLKILKFWFQNGKEIYKLLFKIYIN